MNRDSRLPRKDRSSEAKYSFGRRSLLASTSLTLFTAISPAPAPAQGAAPPQAKFSEIAAYLKPQLVVPIAEGRTINLVCLGHGSPTVVLTAGLGGWSHRSSQLSAAGRRGRKPCDFASAPPTFEAAL